MFCPGTRRHATVDTPTVFLAEKSGLDLTPDQQELLGSVTDFKKDSVIRDVKKYIEVLRANGISVDRALLFGSWAKGAAREESDVDVALVSSFFTGDRFMDRRKIVPFRREINTSIEPVPFRPEDFAAGGILVEEIRSCGEEIV